jgi:hypothetical protein
VSVLFTVLGGAVTGGVLLWLVWRWSTSANVIRVIATADLPVEGFSHDRFERLLRRFTDGKGQLGYDAWHADATAQREFDTYLANLAVANPDSDPTHFADSPARLRYWMHAYNAFVIKAVLVHWPLSAVTDVKAPIEMVKGLGFFYKLRFVAGGAVLSLWEIEREKVFASHRDPRAHFVLNCSSASCPAIRPSLPSGPALDAALAAAATEFVSNPDNVSIDHASRRIRLSTIFKWYEKDFVRDLERRGLPASEGPLDYVRHIAPPALLQELERAAGYAIEYVDYDWSINAVGAA